MLEQTVLTRRELTGLNFSTSGTEHLVSKLVHFSCVGRRHVRLDTGEAHPMGQRLYRLPLTKRAVVDNEIADMLDKGIIRPLRSPWASPIMQ